MACSCYKQIKAISPYGNYPCNGGVSPYFFRDRMPCGTNCRPCYNCLPISNDPYFQPRLGMTSRFGLPSTLYYWNGSEWVLY